MSLTSNQKKFLRQRAHHLKPVVIVGQHGLGENILAEVDIALAHHELIKVRVNAADREERQQLIEQISEHSQAEQVQLIGHVAVFYRPADEPKIQLPR
ncbi:ribosome assembly RNA-binding protein YhbY [Thiohalophilus sp.]|uniref:ribosome assembly RNA-binding protein YhbY n=1 Tax=Thiohalophilus sp. TaxID=3028392 RepID=UPI002ACD752D|nr:ribosome assembly RNA-binding protein YhbY [Thiohalophilus sp.]MDZ7662567.1 ribosome assembly RNA-binding protein YhbY [Thiohalophilus sp.]MDZ7802666.1 ribosome assembly RNA-binding protein YhbY [Thiohalophilus sp.]